MKQRLKVDRKVSKPGALNEIIKYLIVGGLAFVADYSILIFLNKIKGINYLLAVAVGFIIGLIVSFVLSVNWVFKIRRIENKYFEIVIFSFIVVIGLGFNEAIIWTLTGLKSIPIQYSKLIATSVVFFLNYILRKMILFREGCKVE